MGNDYSSWTAEKLVERVISLEEQLRDLTSKYTCHIASLYLRAYMLIQIQISETFAQCTLEIYVLAIFRS